MTRPMMLTRRSVFGRLASLSWIGTATLAFALPALAEEPKVVSGLINPDSVVVGPGGKIYVSTMGQVGKVGDGLIVIVDPSGPTGKLTTFATGFDDPKGMLVVGSDLYVADLKRVWKVNSSGKAAIFLAAEAFPRPPLYLKGLAQDDLGNFYVSDSGDRAGNKGAVYRFNARKEVTLVLDAELTSPQIAVPDGLLLDGPDHLLVADSGEGYLYRYDFITGTAQRVGGGFGGASGIAENGLGGLYISDSREGRLFLIATILEPSRLVTSQFPSPTGIALSRNGKTLLIPDIEAGTLTLFPIP